MTRHIFFLALLCTGAFINPGADAEFFYADAVSYTHLDVYKRQDMDMGVRGTMLAATGIWKSYGRRVILKDIDLEAEPGQCVGIVGANGCGKTTLLSILAGTLKADRGRVVLNGREATGNPCLLSTSRCV